MKNLSDMCKEFAERKRAQAIAARKGDAVNVMEFDGELWVCSFGEPLIPVAYIKEEVFQDLPSMMAKCRDGWSEYMRSER